MVSLDLNVLSCGCMRIWFPEYVTPRQQIMIRVQQCLPLLNPLSRVVNFTYQRFELRVS